jgi:hypothetical protein
MFFSFIELKLIYGQKMQLLEKLPKKLAIFLRENGLGICISVEIGETTSLL